MQRRDLSAGTHSLGGRCDDVAADQVEPVPISAQVLSEVRLSLFAVSRARLKREPRASGGGRVLPRSL